MKHMLINQDKAETAKSAQDYLISILALFSVGLFLRFFLLTNQSLWFDEGLSLGNSNASNFPDLMQGIRNISNSDKFQPLYYIILYWVRAFFGESAIVLRGVSAALGFLSLPVIYLIANRLYGKRHAIWSLALVTFSAFLIYYSQEVRNYSLLIFLSSLQLYFFSDVLLEESEQKSYSKFLFAIVSAVNLFGSITTAVFTAALSLSHLIVIRHWRQWLGWWIPTALLSLLPLLYFFTLPGQVDPTQVTVSRFGFPIFFNAAYVVYGILVGITYGPSQEQLRGSSQLEAISSSGPVLLIFFLVTLTLAVLVIKLFFQRNNKSKFFKLDAFFLSLIISSFILGIVLALVTHMNWVPRHSFYLWLPLSLLLPSILHGPFFKNKVRPVQLSISNVAIIALICLNLYSTFNYYFVEKYWKDDYRSVVHYLVQHQSPDNKTVLLFGSPNLLRYYGDNRTINANPLAWRLMAGDETWLDKLTEIVGDPSELIVAVNREHTLNRHASVEEALSQAYQIQSVKTEFTYFDIYHLSPH